MKTIVLTGGPGGGKTTALNRIFEKLSDFGWAVCVAPEVATILLHDSKVPIGNAAMRQEFQLAILKLQLTFEERLCAILKKDPRMQKVLLCDRGAMDNRAYVGDAEWESLLAKINLNTLALRERYDGVIHLETAAADEDLYSEIKDTNPIRSEDAAEALSLDAKTQQAWLGHPHFRVVKTQENFDLKMQRLWEALSVFLGIPIPIENERKFLVRLPLPHLPVASEAVEIEQTYLLGEAGKEWRVRKRSQRGGVLYVFTEKDADKAARRLEREERISEERYRGLIRERRDTERSVIRKTRRCFLWQNQYFELDEFHEPDVDFALLEIELTRDQEDVSLPDFLTVEKEVTGDPAYYNQNIALKR